LVKVTPDRRVRAVTERVFKRLDGFGDAEVNQSLCDQAFKGRGLLAGGQSARSDVMVKNSTGERAEGDHDQQEDSLSACFFQSGHGFETAPFCGIINLKMLPLMWIGTKDPRRGSRTQKKAGLSACLVKD
jgi:hypothetical protein